MHSCDAAIFDTLPGLVIGIAVSMLLLLHRVSRPHVAGLAQRGGAWLDVERHDDLELNPEVLVRVESGRFLANSDHVRTGSRPCAHRPPGSWCWTRNPTRSSTSRPPKCSPSWPRRCAATASSRGSPGTSANSGT